MRKLIVGSRESRLAVVQSLSLVDHLKRRGVEVELVTMKTTGDRILDRTLDQVGGKGLFVKELDQALADGRIDLAVHCLKDMPMALAPGMAILGYSRREDPRDALVLPEGADALKPGAVIGTSSLRRALQLKALFPGCEIRPVRGNLQTRLGKLDTGAFDALVLAAAGLKRLGLERRISRAFGPDEIIPAAGQGILAVQGRAGEDAAWLEGYADATAAVCGRCERAFVRTLDGGCTSPVCAYAELREGRISLRALYWDPDTGAVGTGTAEGGAEDPEAIGAGLARRLREEARA